MGSITNLEVSTPRLQGDIDTLRGLVKSMHETGAAMMASVNALSAMWEGEAKNSFTTQFTSDYATLQSMEDVLTDLIDKLESARERYETSERNVGDIINSIKV